MNITKNTTLGELELWAKITLSNVHVSFVFDDRAKFPDQVITIKVVVNDDSKPCEVKIEQHYKV